jgi:predicted dinucleotide-utilizing enzyme
MGGHLVDKAVKAVFAALIWHSQELREQVVLYGNDIVIISTGAFHHNPLRAKIPNHVKKIKC